MGLEIDVCGIVIKLQIKGYEPSCKEKWDSQWCDCDFSFKFDECIDYHRENDEVLLSCEVEEIEAALTKLLNDELEAVEEISCIEPDFIFRLYPKRNLREDSKYTYIRPGFEIADIYMEWEIYFWNKGLTDNFLTVTLGREEIISLRDYLFGVISEK